MVKFRKRVNSSNINDDNTWTPLLRQTFVTSALCCIYFNIGMVLGAPTVIIPQLRQANVTVTDNMASWLSSTFSYAGIPWIIILTVMAHVLGRKKTSIFISLATITSFIVFNFSSTITQLLITEVMFGITQGAVMSINIIIIAEYTSPKYRGMFLCLKSASGFWGVWVSNAIGSFVFWGYIPIVGFFISLWTLTICFWPESPHWLASKNRFAECRRAHRWLKGRNDSSEMELEKIIQSQTETDERFCFKNLTFIRRREFYLPILISLLVGLLFEFSGKIVIAIYAVDILKKMAKNNANVYSGMLILDGVTVFSAYVGCFLIKQFKRRIILLSTSAAAMFSLLALSLYLYLVKLSIFSESVYISISLLAGFSIFVSCGPSILTSSLCGELTAGKYKAISIIIFAVVFLFLHSTSLKIGLMIFKTLGLPGTFLFYSVGMAFCMFLLYIYLPETKDKTLFEIEEYFKGKEKVDEGRNLVA